MTIRKIEHGENLISIAPYRPLGTTLIVLGKPPKGHTCGALRTP